MHLLRMSAVSGTYGRSHAVIILQHSKHA